MTGKSGYQGLETLKQRFAALQERIGAMPESCRPGLDDALQELSQAIAGLRVEREAGENPGAAARDDREAQTGQAGKEPAPMNPAAEPNNCAAMLHHIFNAIPDLLTVHDRDFNTILSNWHGYEEIPEAARRGHPKCYRVYHHRDRPCDHCHALEVLATGQPAKVTKVNPVDGRIREVSAYPIRDESGRVVLVVEHVRDVTDRGLAETALKESESRFRTLIEDIPESLFLTDVQGIILAASRVAARRLGKELPEIVGQSGFEHLPPEVAARRRKLFEQVIATGQPIRFEDARGDFHFDVHITPIPDADGKVSRVSILAIDITDRKNAEEALKEKTRLNQILLDAFPCVALLLRPRTREIVASNAAAVKAGALPGTQCFRTWGQRQDPCPWCLAPAAWATGVAQHLEVEDQEISWDAHWIPVAEDLYMHFAFDVTARKQAEREIQRLASFPQMNPQPVLEMDIDGRITYYNQAALKALGEKGTAEDLKNFLPDDLQEILATAKQIGERHFHRELVVNSAVFLENIYFAEQFDGVRLYALDITARKQAEEELIKKNLELEETAQRLEQSRNMLQLIIESIPARVFWKDRDLRYLGCNTLFARDAGFDHPQQLMGRDDFAMGWREQADLYRADDLQVMESRRPKQNISEPQITPAGAKIWLRTSKVPLQTSVGEVFGVLGVYEDVTERRQAEEALAEQHELMDYVIRHDPNAIAVYDNELRYVFVSERYLNDYGIQEKDIIGKHHYEVFPEMPQRWKDVHQRVLAGAVERSEDDFFERPNGSITHNRWECRPWYRADGRIGGMITYTEVTTERKLAESALRESEEHYRSLFENMLNGFAYCKMLFDHEQPLDFIYLDVNRSFETLTGLKDVVGKKVSEVIPAFRESDPELLATYGRVALTGKPARFEAYVEALKMWFSVSVYSPAREYFVAVFDVITARKQAEEALAAHLQFLQLLLDTIPNPIFFKDAQGAYLPHLEGISEPPKAKIPITASFQGDETILLVEDEDMLRGLLAKFLRLCGYTVLEASHGGEALLTCERHPGPIHLMVTDVVMPQMSGRELADRLTPLRPEMKVLYMSGYTEDALVQHGVADPSVTFLQKPFRPIELARRVYAVLHLPVAL